MKFFLSALIAAAALSAATMGTANAAHFTYHDECTTTSNNSQVPTGSYTSENGHKWAGFKQDGTPPDSLTASGGSNTTCVKVQDPIN